MTSALRAVAISVGLLLLALLTAAGILWLALQPPQVAVPELKELVLSDVTVVNPGMERSPGRTLTIGDGRITSITSGESASPPGPNAEHLVGGYVLPGLVEMHAHFPVEMLPGEIQLHGLLYLAHGVTAMRDVGSIDRSTLELRGRSRGGSSPGRACLPAAPFSTEIRRRSR